MSDNGVLCSCGRPIAQERIEELYSPTVNLQRMLDQSFWMTAKLVQAIQVTGISKDRIIVNIREGSDEVDAFADMEGALAMFESKDDEFSLGHAYPFAARIGLYKPDFAVIVSTKGISSEVRDHFKRVTPSSELLYVDNLDQLPSTIDQILRKIRKSKSGQFLSSFDSMSSIEAPISEIISSKLEQQVFETPKIEN